MRAPDHLPARALVPQVALAIYTPCSSRKGYPDREMEQVSRFDDRVMLALLAGQDFEGWSGALGPLGVRPYRGILAVGRRLRHRDAMPSARRESARKPSTEDPVAELLGRVAHGRWLRTRIESSMGRKVGARPRALPETGPAQDWREALLCPAPVTEACPSLSAGPQGGGGERGHQA